jgi:hypothetical protein
MGLGALGTSSSQRPLAFFVRVGFPRCLWQEKLAAVKQAVAETVLNATAKQIVGDNDKFQIPEAWCVISPGMSNFRMGPFSLGLEHSG